MRVIGFEQTGSAGRTRNFQKPLLVMHDAITDTIAARTANAALIAGLKLADNQRDGEYTSCEQATALLRASVEAAEKQVEEQRKRGQQRGASLLAAVGSTASTHIASSFASMASASNAFTPQFVGKSTAKGTERSTPNPAMSSVEWSPKARQINKSCLFQSEQAGEALVEDEDRGTWSATKLSPYLSGPQSEVPNRDLATTEAVTRPSTEHSSRTPQASSVCAVDDIVLPIVSSCTPALIDTKGIPIVTTPPCSSSPSLFQAAPPQASSTPSSPPLVLNGAGSNTAPVEVSHVLESYLTPTTGVSDTAAFKAQEMPAPTSVAKDHACATRRSPAQASRELELYLSSTVVPSGDAAPASLETSRLADDASSLLPLLTPHCLVPTCESTEATQKGPDGRRTLCKTCYNIYKGKRLVLYRSPGMQISVVPHEGSSPVRVVNFEKSLSGACRDFTKPVVMVIDGAEESFIAERRMRANDLVRNCMRAGCGSLASAPGPDGAGTLCSSCERMYVQKRLVLFQERGSRRLSVVAHQGWTPVMQLEPKNAKVEVSVVPLRDVPKGGILSMGYKLSDEKESADEGDAGGSDWEAENELGGGEGEDPDAMDEDNGGEVDLSTGGSLVASLPRGMKAENAINAIVDYNGDLRSFRMKIGTTHHKFKERLRKMFDISDRVAICFKDDEGDYITIGSKADTAEMFHLVERLNIKLLQIKITDIKTGTRPWCRMRRKNRNVSFD